MPNVAIAHGFGKGKQTVKQVLPGCDSNEIVPWWRFSTIRRVVSNPSPDPCPTDLVVKKGSKMRV